MKDTVQAWSPRPGGWQTLQFDHGLWEDDFLLALVEWTVAPACVADVPADAEGALVRAAAADIPATAQQPRIGELLRSREPMVEDLFSALLDELGFPRPPSPPG
ncbi:hypothetical protein [Streptomyces sp. NPDC096132]|uniref:hypothetical protein n=1 Tax=Streptomyces sp. NPDC096132 TaxID=3366075 RepID=UPI00381FD8EB